MTCPDFVPVNSQRESTPTEPGFGHPAQLISFDHSSAIPDLSPNRRPARRALLVFAPSFPLPVFRLETPRRGREAILAADKMQEILRTFWELKELISNKFQHVRLQFNGRRLADEIQAQEDGAHAVAFFDVSFDAAQRA